MLEYSILQTRVSVVEIQKYYRAHYNNDNISPFIEKYNLTGEFLKDFRIMAKVKSGEDCGIFMNYVKQIDIEFSNIIDKHKISNRVIYIENWYDYLDCVSSTKDVQQITLWINLVKNSDMEIEAYTQKFLSNRIEVHEIIKRSYPKVISEGMRGKYNIDLGTK
ncbi:hypothetical protein SAMN02910355_1130 [Terrisporobacter glycolicus]|nr:hypothetical protein SAMN02910355_1130 [Terrisporobacter glycolicus]